MMYRLTCLSAGIITGSLIAYGAMLWHYLFQQ